MAKYNNIPGYPGYYISRNVKLYTRHIPGNTKGELYKNKNLKNYGKKEDKSSFIE